jgi:beta-lactamase regulating signal transducer with metallopeptidase domain
VIATLAERLLIASLDAAVLAALVLLLQRAIPGLPAPLRAWLWWVVGAKAVLALLGVTPLGLIAIPMDADPKLEAHAPIELPVPMHFDVAVGSDLAAGRDFVVAPTAMALTRRPLPSGVDVLVLLWLVGVVVATAVVLRRWWSDRSLLGRAEPVVDVRAQLRLARLAETLGVRTPALASSRAVPGPLVHGLFAPRIVLPPQALGSRREELELVLAHELAHLRRRDLWLGVVPQLARILFFFHPLVAIALREYALAREAACDALALRTLGTAPRDYGVFLLRWGTTRRESGLAAAAVAPSAQQLRRRLEMLRFADRSFRPRPLMAAAILTLLLPVSLIARPSLPDAPEAPAPPSPFTPTAVPAPAPPAPVASPRPVATPRALAAPAPVAPRAPAAPAPAPAPPAPIDADFEGTRLILADADSTITISARSSDRRRFDGLRRGDESLLWFERDGKEYVVRDRELLARAATAVDSSSRIDGRRIELDREQARLSEHHAALAARQAEAAAVQAEFAARAALDHAQVAELQADMQRLVEEMTEGFQGDLAAASPEEQEAFRVAVQARVRAASGELEARAAAIAAAAKAHLTPEVEALVEQSKHLAAEQRELAEHHRALAQELARGQHDLSRELRQIIDEALARGLATTLD